MTEELSLTIQKFRRVRLGLSPLFLIESNLRKFLSPLELEQPHDACLRVGPGWKQKLCSRIGSPTSGRRRSNTVTSSEVDLTAVLAAQARDIIDLWEDSNVQRVLRRRKVCLEDNPALSVCLFHSHALLVIYFVGFQAS